MITLTNHQTLSLIEALIEYKQKVLSIDEVTKQALNNTLNEGNTNSCLAALIESLEMENIISVLQECNISLGHNYSNSIPQQIGKDSQSLPVDYVIPKEMFKWW